MKGPVCLSLIIQEGKMGQIFIMFSQIDFGPFPSRSYIDVLHHFFSCKQGKILHASAKAKRGLEEIGSPVHVNLL